MKQSIFCGKKFKLLLLVVISFLWAFVVFYKLESSLTMSTLWLRKYIQFYYYVMVMFFLITMSKSHAKAKEFIDSKTYRKVILHTIITTIAVICAALCGWLVYMILGQDILLATAAGGIQIILNVALQFV